MGLSYGEIIIGNPRLPEIVPMKVSALADTGAIMLCIPPHIALQLKLETVESRDVTLADGKELSVPYVGPIQVSFKNRTSFSGALVMGDEVLLGAIQMEDMDLVVFPREQKIDVNPLSPNMANNKVK
ncbi:MAG: clan AA aspartic protease [Pseudomonadota bacterium]